MEEDALATLPSRCGDVVDCSVLLCRVARMADKLSPWRGAKELR